MRTSYLGMVNQTGLLLLVDEHPHTQRFLLRRSQREESVCFWAVIDDARVRAIQYELARGERMSALRLLQNRADDLGTILPSELQPNFLDDTA